MGGSASKESEDEELSASESWSTLNDFMVNQARNRRQTLAVSTVVTDSEIQQVKTKLAFPNRKNEVPVEEHLKYSKSYMDGKKQDRPKVTIKDPTNSGQSTSHASCGITKVAPVKQLDRQLTRHQQVTGKNPDHKFDDLGSVHAEATDSQARKQIKTAPLTTDALQRYKSKGTINVNPRASNTEKYHSLPKCSPSYLNLRQALINREDISLESTRYTLKKSPTRHDVHHDHTKDPRYELAKRSTKRLFSEDIVGSSGSGYSSQSKAHSNDDPHFQLSKTVTWQSQFHDNIDAGGDVYCTQYKTFPSKNTQCQLSKNATKLSLVPEDHESDSHSTKSMMQAHSGGNAHYKSSKMITKRATKPRLFPPDLKEYNGDEPNLKKKVCKDIPPGFHTVFKVSDSSIKCKTIVEDIQFSDDGSLRSELSDALQVWRKSGFLSSIEEHATRIPPIKTTSTEEIAEYLTSSSAYYVNSLLGTSQLQVAKAYAIYYWIATNVHYDAERALGNEKPRDMVLSKSVLLNRKALSYDFAILFRDLAHMSQLEAEIVHGKVKSEIREATEGGVVGHTWNTVKLGEIQHQVDCMFGSRFITSHLQCVDSYNHHYFSVPPQCLVFTHYPDDSSQQFLERPISFPEFRNIVSVSMFAFELRLVPLCLSETIHVPQESQYPVVAVDFRVPSDIVVSANLTSLQSRGGGTDRYVFVTQKDNLCTVQAIVPNKGKYRLFVYSKKMSDETEANGRNKLKLCLSYTIVSHNDYTIHYGFPIVHEAASSHYSLSLLHWNTPAHSCVCLNKSGSLTMVFTAESNLEFSHCIVAGNGSDPNKCDVEDICMYNTMLISDKFDTNHSYYQLQAVFPREGWWTVHISIRIPGLGKRELSLVSYSIYINKAQPMKNYLKALAPHIQFASSEPILFTGDDIVNVKFVSSKYMNFRHFLMYDTSGGEPANGFSKVVFDGGVKNKDCYYYTLKIIFPKPGKWFVYVLAREFNRPNDESFEDILHLSVSVNNAQKNASFVNYNESVIEQFGVDFFEDGVVKFADNGQPFDFKFKAIPQTTFIHSMLSGTDKSNVYDHQTFLSCKPFRSASISTALCYSLHAVFPESGNWTLQVFGAKQNSINYSQIFSIDLSVAQPQPQLCYPKFNPAFYQLNMSVETDRALMNATYESSEYELYFNAPKMVIFSWSMEFLPTGERSVSNAFMHYDSKDENSYSFQVIFPKPGEWLVRLFSKQTKEKSANETKYQSVIEFHFNCSAFNSDASFPQIYEPFRSNFNFHFDKKDLPLVSKVQHVPARVTIPFYNPLNVQLWYDIDVKREDAMSDNFSYEDQCRILSDPCTGLHKIMIQLNTQGEWEFTLYARKANDVSKSWTAVLKHNMLCEERINVVN